MAEHKTKAFGSKSNYEDGYGAQAESSARGGNMNINSGSGNQFSNPTFSGQVNFYHQEADGTRSREKDWLRPCLRSLAFPEMESRSHDIQSAAPGTCQWLQKDAIYNEWLESHQGLLWIKGKPGSGKSTLLRHVLKHAREKSTGALILYFFCHRRGSELQHTPFGLYRSLLHQLLENAPDCGSDIVDEFQRKSKNIGEYPEKWQWNPSEVQRGFVSTLSRVIETQHVLLFIDALDECGEGPGVSVARDLQSMLPSLAGRSNGLLICFTCRPYPVLESHCQYEITVEKNNKSDILAYTQARIPHDDGLSVSDDGHLPVIDDNTRVLSHRGREESISHLIAKRADGVFLWAHLVVEKLLKLERDGMRSNRIKAEVETITPNLADLYTDTLHSMETNSLRLFQWLCCARRPLTIFEWQSSLLVDVDNTHGTLNTVTDTLAPHWIDDWDDWSQGEMQDDQKKKRISAEFQAIEHNIKILSAGLAEVSRTDYTLQFIHESVREYFTKDGLSNLTLQLTGETHSLGHAQLHLYTVCCRYLIRAMAEIRFVPMNIAHFNGSIRKFCQDRGYFLLQYAATSTLWHAKKSEDSGVLQIDDLQPLLNDPQSFMEAWSRFGVHSKSHCRDLVHILAYEGLSQAIDVVLKPPLWWRKVTDRVKHRGVHSRDIDNATPLMWAVRNGHVASAQLLIQYGATLHGKCLHGKTALIHAAENASASCVELLLNHGANVHDKSSIGRTALDCAAASGSASCVSLLFDYGANLEKQCWHGQTPLIQAAALGHASIVRLFLERGASVDEKCSIGWTALMHAAWNSHTSSMEVLLDHGARLPNVESHFDWLSQLGSAQALEMIFDLGVDYNMTFPGGASMLLRVIGFPFVSSLELQVAGFPSRLSEEPVLLPFLIAKGADVQHRDNNGRGAKSYLRLRATRQGVYQSQGLELEDDYPFIDCDEAKARAEILYMLLEHGIEVGSEDSDLLQIACVPNDPMSIGMVETLISAGVDPNKPGPRGFTPLTYLCHDRVSFWYLESDSISLVEALLDHGSDVNLKDERGRTPLVLACSPEYPQVNLPKFLLEKGADLDVEDRRGRTPLELAAQGKSIRLIRLLWGHGAEPTELFWETLRLERELRELATTLLE